MPVAAALPARAASTLGRWTRPEAVSPPIPWTVTAAGAAERSSELPAGHGDGAGRWHRQARGVRADRPSGENLVHRDAPRPGDRGGREAVTDAVGVDAFEVEPLRHQPGAELPHAVDRGSHVDEDVGVQRDPWQRCLAFGSEEGDHLPADQDPGQLQRLHAEQQAQHLELRGRQIAQDDHGSSGGRRRRNGRREPDSTGVGEPRRPRSPQRSRAAAATGTGTPATGEQARPAS